MLSLKSQKRLNIIFLGAIFLSTLLPWFGFNRNVQVIQGTILLYNPLALLFLIVVAVSMVKGKNGSLIALIGFLGILLMEFYLFFTWYILTITGEFGLTHAIDGAYPEFYIALVIAAIPVFYNTIICIRTNRKSI